jgi:phenylalanyl-tRNA synthetase beta chain
VFDAAKVHGPITVRLAKPGESLKALDEKLYHFDGSETLVCDERGPEGIGGVMGGMASVDHRAHRPEFGASAREVA